MDHQKEETEVQAIQEVDCQEEEKEVQVVQEVDHDDRRIQKNRKVVARKQWQQQCVVADAVKDSRPEVVSDAEVENVQQLRLEDWVHVVAGSIHEAGVEPGACQCDGQQQIAHCAEFGCAPGQFGAQVQALECGSVPGQVEQQTWVSEHEVQGQQLTQGCAS